MHRRTRCLLIFVICFSIIVWALPGVAQEAKTMARVADVVFVEGKTLSSLIGTPIDQIGLYAKTGESLAPVPFQIDEKTSAGALVLTNGSTRKDQDPNFDENDVLMFMIFDAGDKAAQSEMPPGATSSVELLLTDPVNGAKAWIYASAFSGTAPKSSEDYVRYEAASNVIYAKNYTMGFDPKAPIAIGTLILTEAGGGDGQNNADRLKIRFNAEVKYAGVDITKDEAGFSSEVIAWTDGPVRVVRRTKNKQTLFWKIPTPSAILDNIYYENMFEFPTRVDLPFNVDMFLKKPELRVTTDTLCSQPGWFFLNEKNKTPVAIDGVMSEAEKNLSTQPYNWMVVARNSGPYKGGWMNRLLYKKGETPVVPRLYYNDDATEADPPENKPGHCGDIGYSLENLSKVEKGVLRLTSVMYSIPAYDDSKINEYLNILDRPVRVTTGAVY